MSSSFSVVEEIQRKYDQGVKDVMADLTRSQQWKDQQLNQLYDAARSDLVAAVEEEKQKLALEVRVTRRIAFEAPKVAGSKDAAMATMAYRDGLDRVRKIDTQAELEQELQRAELVADEYLAKACLIRGYELGSSKVVGKYLEFRPEETKKYTAFMDAGEALNEFERVQNLFGTPGRIKRPEEFRA